jgi:starch-binding outer membrane protein, SusD/RagB family
MKIKPILLAMAMIITVSCDDFLEPDSISTFDSQYVFSNIDDARKGVNAIYSYFGQDAFRSRLSNNMTGNTDIEHASGWSGSNDRQQIWDLNALASNRDLDIVWTYAYRAIRDANIAIEGIQASAALQSSDVPTASMMNHLLGESYTLRAYWYSMLIFYFGDVPFIKEAPKAGNDFFLGKEDRNIILAQVIQDMIDIESKMLWADQLPHGIEQVNREYTLGMIARLALQRGGWFVKPDMTMARATDYLDYYTIARDYTKKLTDLKDRPLPADYREVFMNQCKFLSPVNDDILFEVPFAIGNGDVGWNIGIRVNGGDDASHEYGSGNNYMKIPPTYYFSFDTLDIRRDVTCALYKVTKAFEEEFIGFGDGADPIDISQGKWSRHFLDKAPGKASAKGTGINWPMLRYADVLLMFAEAENELNGPTGEAQTALARVRRRAFDPDVWGSKVDGYIGMVSAGKQSFFDAIVDERAWEFGGEMIRKYELIRWGIYSEKMIETVQGLKELTDGAVNGTSDLPDYIFWKRDESGKFIILNPNRKIVAAPDDTWIKSAFLIHMRDESKVYDEWITRDWANYTGGVVRYVFPIPTQAIENSRGILQNDGYGFAGG